MALTRSKRKEAATLEKSKTALKKRARRITADAEISFKRKDGEQGNDNNATDDASDEASAAVVVDYPAFHSGAKQFMLHVFRQPRSNLADSTGLWRKLSPEWQRDRDIASVALINNFVKGCELPPELQEDIDLFVGAIKENPNVWNSLPYKAKNLPVFAKAIQHFPTQTLAWCVLEEVPELCNDLELWRLIMDSDMEDPEQILKDKAGSLIFKDYDLLERADVEHLWNFRPKGVKKGRK